MSANDSPSEGKSLPQSQASQEVELYCALYKPQFENYYHWASAMYDPKTEQWRIFQVVQDEVDGPFIRNTRHVNPAFSSSCLEPLLSLDRCQLPPRTGLLAQSQRWLFRARLGPGTARITSLTPGTSCWTTAWSTRRHMVGDEK